MPAKKAATPPFLPVNCAITQVSEQTNVTAYTADGSTELGGLYSIIDTTAVANNKASIITTTACVGGSGIEFEGYVKVPTTTSVRVWVGLCSANLSADNPTTENIMAFRYATGVDGTVFWRTIAGYNASYATKTTTAPPDTWSRLQIVCNGTPSWGGEANDIFFLVNGQLVSTHTYPTDPTISMDTGFFILASVTTLTGAERTLEIGGLRCATFR